MAKTSKAAANVMGTTIEVLQTSITDNHTKGLASEKSANSTLSEALICYRDCGKDIISLKAECKKEDIPYLPELQKTGVKERTGQRYKQLAEHDRTKDVEADFFKDMLSPTLTTVLKALSFDDEDWNKVISGDNTPFDKKERKKKTSDEIAQEKLKKAKDAFKECSFENISFEQFKKYYESSKEEIIEILDKTITQSNKPRYMDLGLNTDSLDDDVEQLETDGVEA